MARVNVEQKALTDSRFVELGRLLGTDRHAALGRMVLVWNECQERGSRVLPRAVLDNTNADVPDFTSLVVRAELARKNGSGFYIRGAKGRVEWLTKARKNGKLGGRPRKNQTVSRKEPSGSAENNPPAPAPAPAPAQDQKQKKEKTSSSPKKTAKELVEEYRVDDNARAFARRFGLDADELYPAWLDHFRGNGYLVGKARTPVKDAAATFRTWIRNATAQPLFRQQKAAKPFQMAPRKTE